MRWRSAARAAWVSLTSSAGLIGEGLCRTDTTAGHPRSERLCFRGADGAQVIASASRVRQHVHAVINDGLAKVGAMLDALAWGDCAQVSVRRHELGAEY